MQKPTEPFPPYDFDYRQKNEEINLYWYKQIINEEIDEDVMQEELDDEGYKPPGKRFQDMTLADINKLVPSGVSLEQIKIRTSWPRMMDWIDYEIYYERPVDQEVQQAAYQAAMKEYKKAKTQYLKDMQVYRAWELEENIRLARQRLEELESLKPK